MRTLAVVEFFPWPAMNGGQIRLAAALEALADLGELDLLVLCDPDAPTPVVPAGVKVGRIATTPYPSADWSGWRMKWLLHRGVPLQVALAPETPPRGMRSRRWRPNHLTWRGSVQPGCSNGREDLTAVPLWWT